MTTPPPPPPPDKLGYRDWRDDAPQRVQSVVQFVVGFICGVAVVFMSGCSFFVSNVYFTPAGASPRNVLDWQGPAVVAAILFALLLGLILLARKYGKGAFVAGASIGVGVMGLIDGICFFRNWG